MAEAEAAKRVLVVDDERNIRRLLTNILVKGGDYQVDSAVDGVDALEILSAADFVYDLIITDMQMPRLDGEGLLREVAVTYPGIPVVVLTAHKNDRNVIECLGAGTVEYLTKPVSMEKLLQVVRRVLDRHARFAGVGEEISVRCDLEGWVELTAPTDFEYVERFQKFTSLLGALPLDSECREDIRVAVDELGQNAVEWGNRHDRSKLIHLSYCIFKDRIVFKIEDEGEGFSPEGLRDPSINPLEHIMMRMQEGKRAGGYGVYITNKLMDDILFSEKGNMVLMTKYFRKGGGPT